MNNLANRFKKKQSAPVVRKSPTRRDAYGFVVRPLVTPWPDPKREDGEKKRKKISALFFLNISINIIINRALLPLSLVGVGGGKVDAPLRRLYVAPRFQLLTPHPPPFPSLSPARRFDPNTWSSTR